MRIVFRLLVITLVGTWTAQACLAEEAARDGGGPALSAKPDGSHTPAGEDAAAVAAKPDNQLVPGTKGDSKNAAGEGAEKGNAVGRDVKSSASGGKDSDAIDTRIAVQPRRLGRRDEMREGNTKLRPLAPRIVPPRRLSAYRASDRVTRDAIGLPVAGHDGVEQTSTQRHDPPVLVHNPAAATTGFGAGASSGLGRTPSNANPIVRPVPNRGGINGTNLARPGYGPSSVGGPAKPVAGISGTTVRPKH